MAVFAFDAAATDMSWRPHRPDRPEKSEGGRPFRLVSDYAPAGDQPTAIAELVAGLAAQEGDQVLLGVTGSGKTFTMAKVIEATQRPALILAPNKTLAAQLYSEFRSFFPDNAVEFFVSYYDYYQPEAYVPRTDTYIEKDSSINEQIDRMRHSATRAILERDDVIVVASVSCIYGIGSVETYTAMTFSLKVGDRIDEKKLMADLVAQQYRRNDQAFERGTFRRRGDTLEIFPAHYEDRAWRISLFGEEIEAITEFDPLTGKRSADLPAVKIYANSHYVTPRPTLNQAMNHIRAELKERLDWLVANGKLLEAQRLEQRTTFDLEMIQATGACAAAPASRRPPSSSTSRTTPCSSWTRATRPSPRSGPCSGVTSAASSPWRTMASACPPAWTTAPSSSRNGTPCDRRRSASRRRPAPGRWRRPGASSPSR